MNKYAKVSMLMSTLMNLQHCLGDIFTRYLDFLLYFFIVVVAHRQILSLESELLENKVFN